jgi:integrase
MRATKPTPRVRTVHLDAATVTAVRGWQRAQRERALAAGVPLERDPWLISSDAASAVPWRAAYAGSFRWPRLIERAGVPSLRLYDLRHHALSSMLAAGIDVRTAADRLGHNPTTALRVYSHGDETRSRAAATAIGAALDAIARV